MFKAVRILKFLPKADTVIGNQLVYQIFLKWMP